MSDLTHEELTRVLAYDPGSGLFHWRVTTSARAKAGCLAGNKSPLGYWRIKHKDQLYRAHRLAWFYVHREWPKHNIDHINGIRMDNRIANLRDVPQRVNMQNMRSAPPKSRTGLLGVSCLGSGNYLAKIRVNGAIVHIGTFPTPEQAHEAYVSAKRQLHEGCTI